MFVSPIGVDIDSLADLWTTTDRFPIAIMDKEGLTSAYGPTIFGQTKFRDLIAELMIDKEAAHS